MGVGRGTVRILRHVHDSASDTADTMFITTDRASLSRASSKYKVFIGNRLFGGKGANGFPELGERAAEDAKRDIEPYMKDYNLIVVVGTLGKGTGSGAMPVISSLAESTGSFVINICTIPSAVLESLPRTVANHTRNNMLRRGFNMVTVDQDRFLEIYGNAPIHRSLQALDILISGVVTSLAQALYGHPERGITISDLRTLFKEGREGTVLVGDYDLGDPSVAATTFLSRIMMKADVRASKGLLLQMTVPKGAPDSSMKGLLDEIFNKLGNSSRTVFITSLRCEDPSGQVDIFGIATGIEQEKFTLSKAVKERQVRPQPEGDPGRWDIPMVM